MPTPLSRLQIAQSLYPALLHEIGHAIEIERLLSEPHYARDVLLVCDACPEGGLRALAAEFRACAPLPVVPTDRPPHAAGAATSSRQHSAPDPAIAAPAANPREARLPHWPQR